MFTFIILLFIIEFSFEYNKRKIISLSEITITIKGVGNQQIISSSYSPNQIYINEILQNYTGNLAKNLIEEINIIKMVWNNPLVSCYSMFNALRNIIKVDLSKFDTSQLTYINDMFRDCISLTSINFQNFNTSKFLIIEYFFYNCYSLKSLN